MDPVTWAGITSAASSAGTAIASAGAATSAALAPFSPIFTVGSTIMGVGSALSTARDQEASADYEAKQQDVNSKAALAAGSQEVQRQRLQNEMVMSSAVADASDSGGDVLDPSTLHLLGQLHSQGEENEENTLYNAESRSDALENQATASRFQASQYGPAGDIKAVTQLFSGSGSLANKYGPNTQSSALP